MGRTYELLCAVQLHRFPESLTSVFLEHSIMTTCGKCSISSISQLSVLQPTSLLGRLQLICMLVYHGEAAAGYVRTEISVPVPQFKISSKWQVILYHSSKLHTVRTRNSTSLDQVIELFAA